MKRALLILTALALGAQEHGPNVPCTTWCAPPGFEDEAHPPDGIPVMTCAGEGEYSCARGGVQCESEHRGGCSTNCRSQCCSCCSI